MNVHFGSEAEVQALNGPTAASECKAATQTKLSIFQIERLLTRVKQTPDSHFLCVDELPLPANSGHSRSS
jgi:hypothetical protein